MRLPSAWIDVGVRSLNLSLGALTIALAAAAAVRGLDLGGIEAWVRRAVSPLILAVLGALAFAAAFFWICVRSDSAPGPADRRPEPALVPGAAAVPDDPASGQQAAGRAPPTPSPGRPAMFNLVFNLVVLAALVYLVAGGPLSREVRDGAVQAVEAARTVVPLPRPAGETPAPETAAVKVPVSEPAKPAPKPTSSSVAEDANADKPARPPVPAPEIKPPELPPAQVVAERVARPPVTVAAKAAGHGGASAGDPSLDPAVARRRAEVLADGPVPLRAADKPAFMTPAERVRELQRLAEEMEIVFTDRLAR